MTKLINKTSKTILCSILAIFLVSGVAMAADAYQTSGQYANSSAYGVSQTWNNNASVTEAATYSGNTSQLNSGVVTDLNTPYFYENYRDQVYDLSYCDWN